ncbi:MAG: hypothetical protein B6U72_04190 [Candidatus Altiarchaeales archaeon ex4484_2]|nr:MAG: hypothetical protein B6U72_04190 [Candidatus Altiarchaeales archaeon ex4484_2]
MKKREYGDYVEDILDSIDAIEEFVKGMIFEDFKKDKKTVFAVVRAIEIIGEAAKNIPKAVMEKHPQIPWKDMAGMRDKVIHEYFGVDKQVVWETVKHDIPDLKSLIKKILDELGD